MLEDLCPHEHFRLSALPLFGPFIEGFVTWLRRLGYPPRQIHFRVRALPRVEEMVGQIGIDRIQGLPADTLAGLTPKGSGDDTALVAVIRSLTRYFVAEGLFVPAPVTRSEQLVAEYLAWLRRVRGLAASTLSSHAHTATGFLGQLRFEKDPTGLRAVGMVEIEAFIRSAGKRLARGSLQHVVGRLRSFLRFLTKEGLVNSGLETGIDTPRVYSGERLPRSLHWDVVRAFLAAIDRSSAMGKRDYAMFTLIATYGLRTSEVAGLRLEDIEWRRGRIRVPRPKTGTPLVLPLTEQAAAATIDYLRHARPDLDRREVFLRVLSPCGPLAPTAVTEAFQGWTRRSGLPIPFKGPHCLRHSLALHLLRQGASLKAIGDLLGHRSPQSTCVYLRLQVEDLRDAVLDLPPQVHP